MVHNCDYYSTWYMRERERERHYNTRTEKVTSRTLRDSFRPRSWKEETCYRYQLMTVSVIVTFLTLKAIKTK